MHLMWRRFSVVAIFIFILGGSVCAQKAIPVRIKFKPGATSTVVQGNLRGRQQMEYVVAATQNQKLTLQLTSQPPGNLKLTVRDPSRMEIPLENAGPGKWTAVLARSGDYDIWVVGVTAKPVVARYKLTVAIR